MPGWVLVISSDSVASVAFEDEVRMAGYSPRRAPDVQRGQVLLGQGEPPAAFVVDAGRGMDEALRVARQFGNDNRVVAIVPDAAIEMAERMNGIQALSASDVKGGLSALLAYLTRAREVV